VNVPVEEMLITEISVKAIRLTEDVVLRLIGMTDVVIGVLTDVAMKERMTNAVMIKTITVGIEIMDISNS
jgi:hypothetical protein